MTMSRNFAIGMIVAVIGGALAGQQPAAPAAGGPQPQQGGAQGGRGRGGQTAGGAQGARGGGGGRGTATNPADTYGTADTLFTMPEAGQGGGAGDPTAEQ